MSELNIKQKIVELCLQMSTSGLNQGASGNISAVYNEHLLIAHSGIP